MIKSLAAAAALMIGVAGHAIAQEPAHRHLQHHRRHLLQTRPSPFLEPGVSAYVPAGPSAELPDVYWSPAGGNPIHYGQTTGFYGGR
jgi:hypothetical protein